MRVGVIRPPAFAHKKVPGVALPCLKRVEVVAEWVGDVALRVCM